MPLTPFHLAVGLPARKFISMKAFIIVNILIDLEPGLILFFGMDSLGYQLHQGMHTFGGATLAVVVTLFLCIPFKVKALPYLYGAALGGYSHILLDALVHWDVQPFAPFLHGNPMFLDLDPSVTITCAIVLTYYLVKWVESLRVGEVGLTLYKRLRCLFIARFTGK